MLACRNRCRLSAVPSCCCWIPAAAHASMKRTVMAEQGGSDVETEPKRAKDEACATERESSSEVASDGQFGLSARGGKKKEKREKQFDWSL